MCIMWGKTLEKNKINSGENLVYDHDNWLKRSENQKFSINFRVEDCWIECLVLIKIMNGAQVELTMWRSGFQIMVVVNYIDIMTYVDDYWITIEKSG